MKFSSRSAQTASGYLASIALLATSTFSIAPISQAQPGRPPQPGQTRPSGQPAPPAPAMPGNQTPPKTGGWQKFRFPAGRFTVALPQKPIENSETDKDGDVSYTYKVERDENFYLISHFDVAALQQLPPREVRNILQKMPAELVAAFEGKLVRNKEITLRKNPGQEFDFLMKVGGKETPGKGRIYVIGIRVYALISVATPQDSSRFINSFNPI
jgi:hypothetical protein